MIINNHTILFIVILAILLIVIGIILSTLAKKSDNEQSLESIIEQALPGIQCAQCGYPGCQAYAQALINGQSSCNKCVPGGPDTARELAKILNLPLDSNLEDEEQIFTPRTVAFIHKSPCTGCTKCTRVCPVDAINGKVRQAHEVDPNECIGCNECVAICPEGCIEMIREKQTIYNFDWEIKSVRITGGNN